MTQSTLLSEIDADGRAIVTLNRPEVHNAFDDALVVNLLNELRRLEASDRVRVVLLTGSGKTFCAGPTSTGCAAPPATAGPKTWRTPWALPS